MNPVFKLFASSVAALCVTVSALGAEVSPAGTWKWNVQGRQGGRGFEQTLKLDYSNGKLTGTLLGVQGGQFQVPDTAISDVSYQPDGTIKFSVTRELNGNKFTTKFAGKVAGDTIKGTYERPGFNGREPSSQPWEAKREK